MMMMIIIIIIIIIIRKLMTCIGRNSRGGNF